MPAVAAVEVQVATSLEALEEHADAWDRLALGSHEHLPMLSHAWVASFFETQMTDRPWRCLFAYQGDELVGVVPVIRSPGPVRPRLLAPAGWHSPFAYPLLAPQFAAAALRALTDELSALDPGLWMRFSNVRESSPLLDALSVLQPDMRVLRPWTVEGYQGLLVDTSGSFDDFQALLSRNFKKTLRRQRNRARRDHRVDFDFISGGEAAPELLEDFMRLEASGWKGREGTAIACDPARVAFFRSVCRRLARRGWLEWQLAKFDGTVVAADLSLRFSRSLVSCWIAYDERFREYSPGNLLLKETLARSFADDQIDELNCLSDPPWMHVWHMSRARYFDIIVSPRTPLATVSSVVDAAGPRRMYNIARDRDRLRRLSRSVRLRLGQSTVREGDGAADFRP